MLQCWIRRRLLSFVTLCIVAKRCKSYYWEPIGSRIWEIDWYQNEWPWPLFRGRIKVTSTIALHLTLNISESVRDRGLLPNFQKFERSNSWPQYARAQSRKRLDLETPFQRTTNRKWHRPYAVSNGHVTHDHDLERCCEAVRSAILATAWLLVLFLHPVEPHNSLARRSPNNISRALKMLQKRPVEIINL